MGRQHDGVTGDGTKTRAPRIAYVKSGPVAAEARRAMAAQEPSDGGPDAFVEHFLNLTQGRRKLLVSINAPAADSHAEGDLAAAAWPRGGKRLMLLGTLLWQVTAFDPDIIICGELGPTVIVSMLAALICGASLVSACFNRLKDDRAGWLRRAVDWLAARCVAASAAVIAHGPYLASQLRDAGVPGRKVLEFDWRFSAYRAWAKGDYAQDLTEGGRCVVIACIARMVEDKGVTDLLEALAPRLAASPSLRLVYVGDGPARPFIERRVAELGLGGQVLLLGAVPYPILPTIGKQAALVVTPSRGTFPEGRPMTVHESLCLGVPVVAPDYGPFPFAVEHGVNGLLYPAGSVAGLRVALERFLDEPELRAALQAGARASGREIAENGHDFGWALRQALCMAARGPRRWPWTLAAKLPAPLELAAVQQDSSSCSRLTRSSRNSSSCRAK